MVGILLVAFVGITLGVAFDLFDGRGSPQEDVDNADLEQDLALLDGDAIDIIEDAFANDPVEATALLGGDRLLEAYEIEDFADISGTGGNDFIALPGGEIETDAVFAGDGDDVVLGADGDDVIFGENGDDVLFGADGFDQIFGEDGDDTLSGGDGPDLLIAGRGADVVYGGAGNDAIYDGDGLVETSDDNRVDVIVAGDGDDGIVLRDGVNLVSTGAGADHVTVYTESEDNPGAVITDFDPAEDGLLIGVHAPGFALPDGANSAPLGYRLTGIVTDIGTGTLVEPVVADAATAAAMDPVSIGFAVLIGISPDQLEEADIRVVVTNSGHDPFADDSVEGIARAMGATRI